MHVLCALICSLCRRLAYQIFMGEETEGLGKRRMERKGKENQSRKVYFLPHKMGYKDRWRAGTDDRATASFRSAGSGFAS